MKPQMSLFRLSSVVTLCIGLCTGASALAEEVKGQCIDGGGSCGTMSELVVSNYELGNPNLSYAAAFVSNRIIVGGSWSFDTGNSMMIGRITASNGDYVHFSLANQAVYLCSATGACKRMQNQFNTPCPNCSNKIP
jgi:hypothetical protein